MRRLRRLASATVLAIAAAAVAASSAGVFSSYQPIAVQLSAPFHDLIEQQRNEEGYAVTGSLSYSDETGSRTISGVKISLRGHTSKRESECAFPKLKLDFASPPADGLFAGMAAVKVGTHCDEKDEGLTARFGRVANERSPFREAAVYRFVDALGIPTLKARPARIAYVYTDTDPASDAPKTVVKNAMFLEDNADARKRFGAQKEIGEAHFTNAAEQFAPEDTARLAFGEALIGNFDWCLKMAPGDAYRCDGRHPLWNVLAFARNGSITPLIYDFDVSGMVAGRHSWFGEVYNEAFVPSKSHAEVEVISQVQRTRSLFPRDLLNATRTAFLQRKAQAYRTLDDAAIDPRGRDQVREYADRFYAAIGSDAVFYRPVIAVARTAAYADADRSQPACGIRSTIPVGTPVSDPLETRGDLIRVVLLDVLWHWAPPNGCDAVRRGSVWVDRSAISSDYPK